MESSFNHDSLLYGFNDEPFIIGAFLHPDDDSKIVLYKRIESILEREEIRFYPFFYLTDQTLLKEFHKKHWLKELEGAGTYKNLCAFNSWSEMWEAVHYISSNYYLTRGIRLDLSSNDPIYIKNDPACQFFLQTGRTSFKKMKFSDLHRMQLSIAILSTHGYSNPDRESDRIVAIGLSDNTDWCEILFSDGDDEADIIKRFVSLIDERDPDVIEGHNIISFEYPYLLKRSERYGISLPIGRDRSEPILIFSRSSGFEGEATAINIHGRHVVDSASLISSYEHGKREIASLNLHEVACSLGYPQRDRVYIPSHKISWTWENDSELLRHHLENNLKEIEFLCSTLSQSAFHLSSCVPLNYGDQFHTGSAAKIELLLMREYIHKHESLPSPEKIVLTSGGYSNIYYTGLFQHVIHLDIESMYPSIMITNHIAPKSDSLGIFITLLDKLTQLRLDVKRKMLSATVPARKKELDEFQSSLKILINSFYGYLSYSRALFNDYAMAQTIVSEGQRILKQIIDEIRSAAGTPIEVDTDGVYLVPPSYIQHEDQEITFMERIASVLPIGIKISLAGRYKKMLSYKIKNYALLEYDDRLQIKGSALSSRSMERFARNYIESCIDCLMREDINGLHDLYKNLNYDFQNRKMHVRDFVRIETLHTSLEDYDREMKDKTITKKSHSAVHEALIRAGRHVKVGERIAYYFAGNDPNVKPYQISRLAEEWQPTLPDENIGYYLKRIDELSTRFKVFFEAKDFSQIFSSSDELFSFDLSNIKIITTHVEEED